MSWIEKQMKPVYSAVKAEFKDNQKAHNQFWNKYERPPLEEYWDYIVERRDLLVPQDIRERKGSFYTTEMGGTIAKIPYRRTGRKLAR